MTMFLRCVVFVCLTILPLHVQSACMFDGFTCTLADGSTGSCWKGACIRISAGVRNNLRVTIKVKYPEATLQVHKGTDLYIRGEALGLTWQKGLKLNKTSTDTWQTVITYQSADDGFRCQNCGDKTNFNGAYVQYRILIDDMTDMVGGNMQFQIPISKSSSYFPNNPEFIAYPWFFSKNGSVSVVSIESLEIGRNVSVVVYKPPSFYENTFKSYPTILTFDFSKETYNSWADLINTPIVDMGTIGEYILVGFGDYDYTKPDERNSLLTPVSGSQFVCMNGTFADRCGHCVPLGVNGSDPSEFFKYMVRCGKMIRTGGKGNDTLDFFIHTAIPKAKQFTNMRMLTDQPNLGVMGMSLGGLMACHAAWTRPTVFGFAACQSPSFWWPKEHIQNSEFFFNNVTLKEPSLRINRPFQKIYLDGGGLEPDAAMLSAAEDMVSTGAFVWDRNLWAYVFPDYPHTGLHWAKRLWSPLKIFFPTHPAPRFNNSGRKGNGTTSTMSTVQQSSNLRCFACDDVTHLRNCDKIKRCQPDEMCYVSKSINTNGQIRYSSGCTSQKKCRSADTHASGDHCLQCCSTKFCNQAGCGDTGFPDRSRRGPLCLECSHVGTSDECGSLKLCASNQACKVEEYLGGQNERLYNRSCEDKLTCALDQSTRSAPLCRSCCEEDFCNTNCTSSLQPPPIG